jgi:hypothetical protein
MKAGRTDVQNGCLELFSYLPQFLHFVAKRVSRPLAGFPALFFTKEGERHMKHAVHRVGHSRVHLTESLRHSRMKKFGARLSAFWARHGRAVGWNDAAFCKAPRPNWVAVSFQPTICGLTVSRLHTLTT